MRFAFAGAGRVLFGPGRAKEAASEVLKLSRDVVLVTGGTPARHMWFTDALRGEGVLPGLVTVAAEPTASDLQSALDELCDVPCGVIVAIGGGAVLDMAKGIAALRGVPHSAAAYFGRAAPAFQPKVPVIALPTTSGSGSEVTANAVFDLPDAGIKQSLRHPDMRPALAIVDPCLTETAPDGVYFAAAFDALSHNVEAYLSNAATPITDALARQGIRLACRALPRLLDNRADAGALADMAAASVLGGMALANGGLGIVHGLAAVICGRSDIGHGATCARLLSAALDANLRHGTEETRARIEWIARQVGGAATVKALARLDNWLARADLPKLGDLTLRSGGWDGVARDAATASSSRRNPVALTAAQIVALLDNARQREGAHAA